MIAIDRALIAHGVDHLAWAKRFGIKPLTKPCRDCGAEKTTTIPFQLGAIRGLLAPKCACGSEARMYCAVHLDPDRLPMGDGT